MANFVVDALTDTAGTLLENHTGAIGASWTKVTGSTPEITLNSSGALGPSAADAGYYASGTSPSANYSVQMNILAPAAGGTWNAGVLARVSTSADTAVWALYNAGPGANNWALYQRVGGSPSLIAAGSATTLTPGATYTLLLVVSGTTATLSVNGTQVCTGTTTITANGPAGIHLYSNDTSGPYCSAFSAFYSSSLAAGTASTTSVGSGTASVAVTAASGGTSPYTYQWYRSTTSGFTPGSGNIVSGATSLTLNDSGLTNGTTYYYVNVVTDSASATAQSNQTSATPSAGTTTVTADNTAFRYVGKGALVGTGASARWKTINTGGQIYARLLNTTTCTIVFDVSNCSSGQYPDILYVLDGGPATRVTLTSTGQVVCTFPTFSGVSFSGYSEHTLEIWIEGCFDAGTTPTNVWNSLIGAAQFQGLVLDSGATLAAFTVDPYQIEFCGDSLTDTVHMLSASSWSQTWKGGHIGWPALTAKALGMLPVPNGFPGDGLVNTSGGPSGHTLTYSYVPLGATADPLCFAGQSYTPATTPSVVVVAYGTNDAGNGTTDSQFQTAYLSFLEQKRAQYPKAVLVALVLPSFAGYLSYIQAAVTAFADGNTTVANLSSNSYATTDGVHLSYVGAVALAIDLSAAIRTFLGMQNINLNLNSDPGHSNVRTGVTYYANGASQVGTYGGSGGNALRSTAIFGG